MCFDRFPYTINRRPIIGAFKYDDLFEYRFNRTVLRRRFSKWISVGNLLILFLYFFHSIRKYILSLRTKSVEDYTLNKTVYRVSFGIYFILGENSTRLTKKRTGKVRYQYLGTL